MPDASFQFDHQLRVHLRDLLASGQSHAKNDAALADLPTPLRGKKIAGIEHTAWQMLEHMRIAQADILVFCSSPHYKAPAWPDDYWPRSEAPSSDGAWDESRRQFFADLDALQQLIADPKQDLFAPIPWGDGQTLLREALLVADHNSYHLGQIVQLRKALGAWN